MTNRRSTYFIFQALLTVILLLFFLYRREFVMQFPLRLFSLSLVMGGLLIFIAKAPQAWLGRPGVQGTWFLCDVLLSSLTLYWAGQPSSDLYVTYFLVIFGTALTENVAHSFLVALVATLLYGYSAIAHSGEIPKDPEFWLRLPYLWIFASFTAMLTRDSRQARQQQEATYRERLFHVERLAALGQISAEVAHRIKAPLTTIQVNAEVLAHQKDTPARMQGELIQIQQEVGHCKEILQKLLELGRIEEMDVQQMDLRGSIHSALETVRPQLQRHQIQLLSRGLEADAPLEGDPILIAEAILAVLQNAVEAMEHGGELRISLNRWAKSPWWTLRKPPKNYEIVIEDTGVGIQPTQMETVFRPFFTTKKNQGSGLGLSAALRIVDKHGGTIKAYSAGPNQGARFHLTFPSSKQNDL
jgi:signal transduction histidine kinase